ncbi:outer membrane protein assembly factor BamB [Thiomicrorhabdus sp. ZW0627]|uniref:outer membrane protein assembly factor BamB n=1 Tax=Thiomicrorhabdus sp. ZW0627 TaxID=3039774 RepID=UPI002436E559|nr:outer membrane protein assembly factor BamB [Thiomicrorhabdus sp. ZW0627]MDG6774082.1 outer membrane protein assembly factor BamB [Thiomicrorhabdus sp. ZW0627]
MNLFRTVSLILLALGLTACSSSKVVRVPTALTPLDSSIQIERNWQVQLSAMRNSEEQGLDIAQDTQAVFVADSEGMVSAFKKLNQSRWTDQVIWQNHLSEKIVSGPVLAQGRLIIGTSKGKVISLSAMDGQVEWQTQLSSEVLSKATIAGDKIYTRTVDGKLYELNLGSGEVVWVKGYQVPNLSLRGASPVLYDNKVLYVGWETGKVEAVSAETGNTIWEARIAIPSGRTDLERMVDVQSALVLKSDRLIALGYHGKLAAISLESGNLYYAQDVSGYRDFIVDDQAIYMVDEDDVIHAYDISNGTELWNQVGLKFRNLGDLLSYKNMILAVDGYGYVHWLDKLHGTIVARAKHSNDYGDENIVIDAMVDGDTLYMLDSQGTVNSYQLKPSDLMEHQTAVVETAEQGK